MAMILVIDTYFVNKKARLIKLMQAWPEAFLDNVANLLDESYDYVMSLEPK